ncbi:MAG TPA: helix-turn-helix transcriptional regulator [Pyrinomonadaceae bacterium]|jgi:transcriptional regulator with XRE-family HTH domain|nr:helix-turn-helix transcriptional regulator [Pyrinomonadaceae bacterium]
MTDDKSTLGKKVRHLRNHRLWNQEKLSDMSGLSQSEISKIENGQPKTLSHETIRKLAKGLEVTPEFLVRGTPFASMFGQAEIVPFGTIDSGPPLTAYFASALTGLTTKQKAEIAALDQKIDEICNSYKSYSIALYRPRMNTDPEENRDVPARDVYEIDRERVTTADLLFLAVVFPSLGAGMELQLAHQSCKSVILLKKEGQPLSRMVLGCPVRLEIVEYKRLAELADKVTQAMDRVLSLAAQTIPPELRPPSDSPDDFGSRLASLREQRKFSQDALANIVGVDAAYIESLESKPEQITNPSLTMLRRLAKALRVEETYLVSGCVVPLHQKDRVFGEHYEVLRSLAKETDMPEWEFENLWERHVEKYQLSMNVIGADQRTEIGDKKYWEKERRRLNKKQGERNGELFSRD